MQTGKVHRVVTYLDESYKQKLIRICSEREINEAQAVRDILREYFEKHPISPTLLKNKDANQRNKSRN